MTETTKSGLPSLEKIREESTMRIITVSTESFKRKQVETSLIITNSGKYQPGVTRAVVIGSQEPQPLVATLLHIDDERIKGFMPSKVWAYPYRHIHCVDFNILYYINTTLPQAVKPFKDNTYLMFFVPGHGDEIEYNVNIRFFMDQIPIPDVGMAYVIMFGEEAYKDLIVREIPGSSVE